MKVGPFFCKKKKFNPIQRRPQMCVSDAATFSRMAFSIMTFSITIKNVLPRLAILSGECWGPEFQYNNKKRDTQHNNQQHYAVSFILSQNVTHSITILSITTSSIMLCHLF